MGYIHELRKLVGNMPIICVGATIVVYNKYRQILLQLRGDTNTWGLPGGSVEEGERVEGTAKRELYEETGLEVDELKLINVLSGPEYFFVYPNGDQMHTIIVLYEALGVKGNLKIDGDETKELKYFDLSLLPQLESRTKNIITWLDNNKNY
jgi:ADP-ribose pyrophosphatase YjhB (NUDIX family)